MEKRFKIADVGGLLDREGIDVRPELINRDTRLHVVELIGVSSDNTDSPSFTGFELVFMDPHDDMFYKARIPYDNDWAMVIEWLDMVDAEGVHVRQFDIVIDDDGDTDHRGILPGDMLSCPRVEKRDVTVKRWVCV